VDVVTLYEVCDRRKLEDLGEEDKSCHFIFEEVVGGLGNLERVVSRIREGSGKEEDEAKIPRSQFLEWACKMAEIVTYLHNEHFIMHTDLHARNWLVREDGTLVICDFGCAKILGKDGKRSPGEKCDYAPCHSPPEMQIDDGKIIEEFSFNGDTWQLACCFETMLNGGRHQ
jgi:serine/threonine protein kinase